MPKRSLAKRLFYDALRVLSRVLFAAFFRIRCTGRQNWPSEGAVLACSNHQSYFDPVLVGLTCDRRLNFLARSSLFHFPFFAWLIRVLDAIPIEREGMGIGGLKETLRRLRAGEIVLVFPEGTRTLTGELSELKPGFCALVRRSDVTIVPLAIDGAFQAWPKGQAWPRPGPIHVAIGTPISPATIGQWNDEELVAALAGRIQDCLTRARSGRLGALGHARRCELGRVSRL